MEAVLLVSSVPGSLEVQSNTASMRAMLTAARVAYTEVDGADGANKAVRARLFSTSGKTAVYPQLFGVQGNGEFTFIADWPALSDANENKEIGQLEALLAGVARRRSVVE